MKKKQKSIPLYIHGIQRSVWITPSFTPPPMKRAFNCHCCSGNWKVICDKCWNLIQFSRSYGVPVRWAGVSPRVTGSLVNMTGSLDGRQFDEVLEYWGVSKDLREYRGVKRAEVYFALPRQQVQAFADYLRHYAVVPCPNRLEEAVTPTGNVEDDPSDDIDADYTDGTKRVMYSGELVETTLPRFDKGVRYYLSIYQVERTPEYPAKAEIVAVAPPRVWLSEDELSIALKGMGQLLSGIALASDIEPVEITPWAKMKGEPLYLKQKRGLAVKKEWMYRAAGLIDQLDLGEREDGTWRRETIRKALPLAIGRTLTADEIAERLNSAIGRRVIERLQGRYRYRWIPQTETMRRLRAAVLGSRRLEDEDGEPPEADAIRQWVRRFWIPNRTAMKPLFASDSAAVVEHQEDDCEFNGMGDDLFKEAVSVVGIEGESVAPASVADCPVAAKRAENEDDEFRGLGDDLFRDVPPVKTEADDDDEFHGLDKKLMLEMGLLSPACK